MRDGREYAKEGLKYAAYQVIQAYYKAPQMTSRVKLQSMVLEPEDLKPMLDVVEALENALGRESVANMFMPIYMDYIGYKDAIAAGHAPMTLLLGADLTKSELGWDCGACGFPSCNEFNRYGKDNPSIGKVGTGPSCAWKTIDYSIAVDYACATAWQLNLENRIQGTFGGLAYLLGYLDNASMVLSLPLIPVKELWFYNRPFMHKIATWPEMSYLFRANYSLMFQMFSSNANPPVKDDGAWWDKAEYEREIGAIFHSPVLENMKLETAGKLFEVVINKRMEVEAIKADKLAKAEE